MLKNTTLLSTLLWVGMLYTNSANAGLLVAGDSIALPGTTEVVNPELGGVVLNDGLIYDSVSPSGNSFFAIGANVQNRVFRSNLTGELIFAPRIIPILNNTSGNFLIDSATLYGFSDYALDVNYRTDGLGDRGPNQATRSANGNDILFNFYFPLVVSNLFQNPQESSYFFSIYSNATAYNLDGRMTITGRHLNYPGQTFTFSYANIAVPTFANAVNSPAIYALFTIALIALFYRRA